MISISLISDLSNNDKNTLRDAWELWGIDLQMTVFEEELSELCEAIALAHVGGARWSNDVFEELADVLICYQQIEIYLREDNSNTIWMDVEDYAVSTEVAGTNPDDLLLVQTLRVIKAIAKSRRYSGGNIAWTHNLRSELGALLRVMQRTERYLRGTEWICSQPQWDEVEKFRVFKMDRLRKRIDAEKEQSGNESA